MHQLLPDIEVVPQSWCQASPVDPFTWEDGLSTRLASPPMESKRIPSEMRRPAMVTVPLGATEDMLIGTIDVEASVRVGSAVLQPGILARANRGVLYLDEANLLDENLREHCLAETPPL